VLTLSEYPGNDKGLTLANHPEILKNQAQAAYCWAAPSPKPAPAIVNFSLPSPALSAPLTYLLRALLAIFAP